VDLPTILLISAAISIGATVIAVLVAFRSAREARSAIFPIVREEESSRARRARVSILVWIAVTALLLGGWLASLRLTTVGNTPLVSDSEPAQPTETGVVVEFATQPPPETLPANSVTPPATSASTSESPDTPPTVTEIASPTPALATSSPVPTETPTSIPPTATPSPVPLGPAPSEAQMGPIEFATEITSPPIKAVNSGEVFSPGTEIYAVYTYQGMQNGTYFTAVWYRNGSEVARDERAWEWGWQGRSYSFLTPPGAGEYKLELYVNDSLLASGSFEIR
jgi:hypothetical protein